MVGGLFAGCNAKKSPFKMNGRYGTECRPAMQREQTFMFVAHWAIVPGDLPLYKFVRHQNSVVSTPGVPFE